MANSSEFQYFLVFLAFNLQILVNTCIHVFKAGDSIARMSIPVDTRTATTEILLELLEDTQQDLDFLSTTVFLQII